VDITALFNISYGLYVIGTKDGGRFAGCVVNTVTQATAKPVTITVCINKDNYTNACIKNTKEFSVSILTERVNTGVIGVFGFSSSRDRDKFAEFGYGLTTSGLPYINEGVAGYLQCKVIDFVDNYTHTIFIAEVLEAENLYKEPPMTYAYYHRVIKGKPAKNAPTYVDERDDKTDGGAAYKCGVCGYEYTGGADMFERLPDNYICPICRAAKSKFALNK
jgi:flavin reductase (DIM6/NTAB) family NADH-FMN oxidoreductase RutF/rubredoxin